ncbi:unnamed protein product [Boreogadus saida]
MAAPHLVSASRRHVGLSELRPTEDIYFTKMNVEHNCFSNADPACYRTLACLTTRLLSSPCRPVCSPVSSSSPACLPS